MTKKFKELFLKLTSRTCPHGFESIFTKFLPTGYNTDQHGNHFIQIGENPTTMFTCHLDTACQNMEKVQHVFSKSGEFIGTNGTTILGADDKAGMVIILHMIENKVPGLYYFFLGEEVGCIGSKKAAKDMWLKNNTKITKVVSFDRRGYDSVITHQFYGRCCSDQFAVELSKQLSVDRLDFRPDETGICTDSIQYQDFIPECTNISVGYFNEHTGKEIQNIFFLELLGDAVLKVDWENLPVVRDPSFEEDWKSYKTKTHTNELDAEDSDDNDQTDLTFSNEFYVHMKNDSGVVTKYLVAKERIQYEIEIIASIITDWGYEPQYDKIDWNGTIWKYSFQGEPIQEIMNRIDLTNISKDFGKMQMKYLRETDEQTV